MTVHVINRSSNHIKSFFFIRVPDGTSDEDIKKKFDEVTGICGDEWEIKKNVEPSEWGCPALVNWERV